MEGRRDRIARFLKQVEENPVEWEKLSSPLMTVGYCLGIINRIKERVKTEYKLEHENYIPLIENFYAHIIEAIDEEINNLGGEARP